MRYLSILPLALLTACSSVPSASSSSTQSVVKSERVEPDTQVLNSAQGNSDFARSQRFEAWRADFTQRALARGYSSTLLAQTIGRAQINERAIERNAAFKMPNGAQVKACGGGTEQMEDV